MQVWGKFLLYNNLSVTPSHQFRSSFHCSGLGEFVATDSEGISFQILWDFKHCCCIHYTVWNKSLVPCFFTPLGNMCSPQPPWYNLYALMTSGQPVKFIPSLSVNQPFNHSFFHLPIILNTKYSLCLMLCKKNTS